MSAADMVDAALAGLDQGELVTIPLFRIQATGIPSKRRVRPSVQTCRTASRHNVCWPANELMARSGLARVII